MNLAFKCLPIGALPYTDKNVTARMIMKLFENIPYLPLFPLVDSEDNLIHRTLGNIPNIVIKENKIILSKENIEEYLQKMDIAYNSPTEENLELYSFNSCFLDKYMQIIKRTKAKETVISLFGPFSIFQMLQVPENLTAMIDKNYRKFVTEISTLKALWIINKIRKISPETTPVIIFEENKFNLFGTIKRENENITSDTVISFYSKIFEKIHEAGGAVGIHSKNKCDWQIPIEAGADIISFDAYNNPNNLNIIADKIQNFLKNGGYINWGIIPGISESVIKSAGIDNVYDRFLRTTEALIEERVNRKLLYSRSKVSVTSDLNHLPLIFAEKALILSSQLAKKIPKKA